MSSEKAVQRGSRDLLGINAALITNEVVGHRPNSFPGVELPVFFIKIGRLVFPQPGEEIEAEYPILHC